MTRVFVTCYFDLNFRWQSVPGRLTARRIPKEQLEPDFADFTPF